MENQYIISTFAQNINRDIICNMKDNINNATRFIAEFLGYEIKAELMSNDELMSMPIALSSCYGFYNIEFFNQLVTLAVVKGQDDYTPTQLAKHQEILRTQLQRPILFVLAQLESHNLTRLTRAKVNFIVPGKIFFAPSMMVLLRNIPNTPKVESVTMPPVAQLLVLYHLQKDNLNGLDASQLAEITGMAYTTINKAIKWLSANQLVTRSKGKKKYIHFVADRQQLWEKSMLLMSSPVERIMFADEVFSDTYIAGESAMGEYTMLAEPTTQVVALSKYLTKQNQKKLNKQYGEKKVEIWSYNPALLANGDTVDRLSLYLSLKDNPDERVQMECDTLIREIVW